MNGAVGQRGKSLLEIHSAVMLFGLAGLFGKLVRWPAPAIVWGRCVVASLFLAAALWPSAQSLRLKQRKDYLSLMLLGLLLALHWCTFFQAIQVSTVAIGLLTYSTFPVFAAFLEPYFFNERLRAVDVLVALIALAGVFFVIPEFTIGNRATQGVLWGTASGLSFALLSILNRKHVMAYSSLVIALYQDSVAAIVLTPVLVMFRPQFSLRNIALVALLGIVFTGIAHTLFIQGLVRVRARTASLIACLEPVYGILAAGLVLGEIPSHRILFGGAVILGASGYATLTAKG